MTLSKEQIVFIDDYLKSKRLKYWDIRLEMVDHLASKLEQEPNLILDEALLKQEFGDLFKIQKTSQIIAGGIKKKYRKLVFKEVKLFLTHSIGWVFLSFFYILEYLIFRYSNNNLFIKTNIAIIILSLLPIALFSVKNIVQKNRSKHLELAATNVTLSFSLINFPIMMLLFLNPEGTILDSNKFWLTLFLMTIVPIHLLFTYCGFKFYLKTNKGYTQLFNEQCKINAAN
ncbi:MAG: hypothetical protein QM486_00135 [Flavobacteriaceae bacterium]